MSTMGHLGDLVAALMSTLRPGMAGVAGTAANSWLAPVRGNCPEGCWNGGIWHVGSYDWRAGCAANFCEGWR